MEKRIKEKEKVYEEYVRQKFKDYEFKINWTSSEPYDIENEAIDVRITTSSGEEYSANFTTLKFLDYVFEKNRRTGECSSGTYFCMPGMIIVEKLTEDNIKRTIDDLIDRLCVENYLTNIVNNMKTSKQTLDEICKISSLLDEAILLMPKKGIAIKLYNGLRYRQQLALPFYKVDDEGIIECNKVKDEKGIRTVHKIITKDEFLNWLSKRDKKVIGEVYQNLQEYINNKTHGKY